MSLSSDARLIYLHLLATVDSTQTVRGDHKAIARVVGVSPRKAQVALSALTEVGLLIDGRIVSTSELYDSNVELSTGSTPTTERPLTKTERQRKWRQSKRLHVDNAVDENVDSEKSTASTKASTSNSTFREDLEKIKEEKDKENKEIEKQRAQDSLPIPAQILSEFDQKVVADEQQTQSKVDQKPTAKPKKSSPKPSPEASEVWEHWRSTLGHPRAVLDERRLRLIEKAIESHGLEVCKKAIEGCKRSSWHMGQNAEKRVYDGVELILRDAEHIERFVAITEVPQRGPQQLSHNYGAHAGLLEGLGETNIEPH